MSGLNDIIFNKGEGGLGAPLPGEDQFSGILFYSDADLPSGFDEDHRIKKVFSLSQAESLGITYGHIDEVLATGSIECTGDGQVPGDKLVITIVDDLGNTINIGTLISQAGSAAAQAIEINALINSGTGTHGFTSTVEDETVTVIAPSGTGAGANNYAIAVDITGGSTVTIVQPTGGEASTIDPLWYHVREFFRMQPKGVLWIGIYTTEGLGVYEEVNTIQQFAAGKIRQLGIYTTDDGSYDPTDITLLQTLADGLETDKMPLSILLSAQMAGDNIADLDSVRTLNSPNVSVCIGQDGAAIGNAIFRANDAAFSIGMVGTALGAIALAKVNESIEWVSKFNIANVEFETLAFATGEEYAGVPRNELGLLNDEGFIFGIKYTMINGSYFAGSNNSTALTSDYAKIESVRTIDKSERSIYAFMLPALGSPLTVDGDGKLSLDTIGYFESLATRALEQMQRDGELSDLNVIVDPDQDVLSTGELVVTEEIVPKGVARKIVNNIGFVTKIS